MNKVAVLSKFRERDASYSKLLQSSGYNIMLYNKDKGENLLPNVGREGHTYLHYIIENYNNLPDEILFSQYDGMPHFKTVVNVEKFLEKPIYDFLCIGPTDYDRRVKHREIKWLDIYRDIYQWPRMTAHYFVPTGTCRFGIFRVTKEAILSNKKDFYKRCILHLNQGTNPPEGFFFERAWKYIFTNYGFCPQQYYYIRNSIWLFGDKEIEKRGSHKRKDGAYGHVKFYGDGNISSAGTGMYSHARESHWTINGEHLYILADDGELTSKFKVEHVDVINQPSIKGLVGDKYFGGKVAKDALFLNKAMWQDYFFPITPDE